MLLLLFLLSLLQLLVLPGLTKNHTIESLRGLEALTERTRIEDQAPTFKFLHLMNTHFPLNIDEECKITPIRPRTRANFKVQARCGLDAFLSGSVEDLDQVRDTAGDRCAS